MKKNILYIWDADYPWDVRVEKICMTFQKNNYEVHIAARNLKKRSLYEDINGLHVHRVKTWDSDRLNGLFSFPFFFNPIWKKFLDRIVKENSIDLIIVRDLPMAIAGIMAGKINKIPVIFDMAEDYVSLLKAIWRARKFSGLNLIVRNPYLSKFVERYAFKHSDHIFVVAEEASEVVFKRGGSLEKVTVIGNTPNLQIDGEDNDNNLIMAELIESRFSAIYVGGIQLGRGLQIVIAALPEIVKKIPDFLFVVVGEGYAKEQLMNMVHEKGLDNYVLWTGWVDHEMVYSYVKLCKIGLIPHLVNEHKNSTVPNKLFDYMRLGIPVIASNALPLQRIISEEQCGVIFEGGSPESLATAINALHASTHPYGISGQRAIRNKYNWENEEIKLLSLIEKMIR